MTFPVVFAVGGLRIPAHPLFELLGYIVGAWLLLRERRQSGDLVTRGDRWWLFTAACVGGALGARAFHWLDITLQSLSGPAPLATLPGGKSIVGGLIGGKIAVDLVKSRLALRVPTGDLVALPLAVGIAIGRMGCFLTGLDDGTYGVATTWWTGVDFGDGIRRHPTQLYEIVFLAGVAIVLATPRAWLRAMGARFRFFMMSYFAFRLIVDAAKPEPRVALGLSTIQWACVIMLIFYVIDARRTLDPRAGGS